MYNPWFIDNVHILLRLLTAMLLGGLIGLERERSNHAAGLRTHILVCLGSALIMLLSIYGFSEFVNEGNVRIDPARLAASVITGIGFLGAGTILFTGKSITGLTTAASVWIVAALGLAVGAGFYFAASVSTVLVLLTLWGFNILEQRFIRTSKYHVITLLAASRPDLINNISNYLQNEGIRVKKVIIGDQASYAGDPDPTSPKAELTIHVTLSHSFDPMKLVSEIKRVEGVCKVSVD
ncbi:MgtC/SapB family protein [Paenibacillus sediminis]|uniref:Mg2+ transporter-C (MgtC) family protein n=1 Tax=Paenibacillus sediminis TaxID=664909 RepID=A0ABS4H4V1_9BACL|nr:MgtC/SapB family protein [Paenibacillus sediminis]MBP1937105.1 putative Mg2+ transporter-C (MgtC) family protein [Paenibacillus sediminis]